MSVAIVRVNVDRRLRLVKRREAMIPTEGEFTPDYSYAFVRIMLNPVCNGHYAPRTIDILSTAVCRCLSIHQYRVHVELA